MLRLTGGGQSMIGRGWDSSFTTESFRRPGKNGGRNGGQQCGGGGSVVCRNKLMTSSFQATSAGVESCRVVSS